MCYGLDFECHPKSPHPPVLKDFFTSLRHYQKVVEPGGEGKRAGWGGINPSSRELGPWGHAGSLGFLAAMR